MLGAMLSIASQAYSHAAPLAAVTLADQPILLYIIMGGLVVFASVARNVLGMVKDWRELKSNPTGAQFATRSELREVHARVDGITASISGEVGKLRGELLSELRNQHTDAEKHRESLREDLSAIERSLGRVEGMEHVIKEHGESIRHLQSQSRKA